MQYSFIHIYSYNVSDFKKKPLWDLQDWDNCGFNESKSIFIRMADNYSWIFNKYNLLLFMA